MVQHQWVRVSLTLLSDVCLEHALCMHLPHRSLGTVSEPYRGKVMEYVLGTAMQLRWPRHFDTLQDVVSAAMQSGNSGALSSLSSSSSSPVPVSTLPALQRCMKTLDDKDILTHLCVDSKQWQVFSAPNLLGPDLVVPPPFAVTVGVKVRSDGVRTATREAQEWKCLHWYQEYSQQAGKYVVNSRYEQTVARLQQSFSTTLGISVTLPLCQGGNKLNVVENMSENTVLLRVDETNIGKVFCLDQEECKLLLQVARGNATVRMPLVVPSSPEHLTTEMQTPIGKGVRRNPCTLPAWLSERQLIPVRSHRYVPVMANDRCCCHAFALMCHLCGWLVVCMDVAQQAL